MKNGVISLLKARYLINEDANKTWKFLVFIVFLAVIMIWNSHRFEEKIFLINEMDAQVKELRSEFVDKRSELMKLKMESTVAAKMEAKQIFPSSVPPQKIKIKEVKPESFWTKIWK